MQDWIRGVVHVAVTRREPSYDDPWQATTSTSTGSALVIGPGRLLCAANLVANAIAIGIQSPSKIETAAVQVAAVNHDCDLALLELAQPSTLLDDIVPARLGALPRPWDEVAVVGCADGGNPVVVRGVVSAIAVQRYAHSQRHLLTLRIDAAITEGVGPVFQGGALVGLVMQKGEQLAECVPVSLIRTFLEGVRNERVPEVPGLGFTTQNLENARLRAYYGLEQGQSGVVVTRVEHGGSAHDVIQRDDLVLAIAGRPVSELGLVDYEGHAVRYDVVLGDHHTGDSMPIAIRRAGRGRTVMLPLRRWAPLVPRSSYDRLPRYLIFGGLVFQPLTRDYLTTWDEWWNQAPKEFLNYYYLGQRTPAQDEIVVLTRILEDELNAGYTHLYNEAVATLDGRIPRDFQQFAAHLRDAHGSVRIETTSGGIIVLDADEVRRMAPSLLARYEIPADHA